jgi:hypothetical protein
MKEANKGILSRRNSSFKVIISEITELEMALGIHDLSKFTARV